ncbi:uncharacterized protein [Ptychodera flava]|uniref:uncharacterized protein n=1 Tax=Ptychodera flava TaxID=63121 RepID=UPI00396A3010
MSHKPVTRSNAGGQSQVEIENTDQPQSNEVHSDMSVQLTAEQLFHLEIKKLEIREKDREAERERERQRFEAQLEKEKLELKAQLDKQRLEFENRLSSHVGHSKQNSVNEIKLVSLQDNDDVDVYLRTFERLATTNKWDESEWVIRLVPALTGKAREAYVSLPREHSTNYNKLKEAIFQRYKLNAQTYRSKFRNSCRRDGETYTEWATRTTDLFDRWMEAEKVDGEFQMLKQVILKEQAYNSVPKDMSLWLREKEPETIAKIGDLADQYIAVRGDQKSMNIQASIFKPQQEITQQQSIPLHAENHKLYANRNRQIRCFNCNKFGHIAAHCSEPRNKPTGIFWCKPQSPPCFREVMSQSPYETFGSLNGERILILRDTGCSHSVANKRIVSSGAYTGKTIELSGIEGQNRRLPVANVYVTCEYFKGWIDVAVHPTLERDLLLGNEIGDVWERHYLTKTQYSSSKFPETPSKVLVVTRNQQREIDRKQEQEEKENLESGIQSKSVEPSSMVVSSSPSEDQSEKVISSQSNQMDVESSAEVKSQIQLNLPSSSDNLKSLQSEDLTLAGVRDRAQPESLVDGERVAFFFRNDLLYRKWSSKNPTNPHKYEQLVVPQACRSEILRKRSFQVGQKVLLLLPTSQGKLQASWKGPYTVTRQVSQVEYEIDIGSSRKCLRIFHVNLLRLWVDRESCFLVDAMDDHELSSDVKLCEIEGPQLEQTQGWQDVKISDSLTEPQKLEVRKLLYEYQDIFSDVPGRTSLAKHSIITTSQQPIHQKPYRHPPAIKDKVREEVQKMLSANIIQSSCSPWASPIVMVPKKDHTIRFCVDYRRLNQITQFDAYPMARIDEILDEIGRSKFISSLDLTKGYWQIPLDDDSRAKSAFITPFGLYEYLVMPFGMQNAPATFQRLIDSIFSECQDYAKSYFDDVNTHSEDWSSHLTHLREVFERIRQANLTAKPDKCVIGASKAKVFGHIVGNGYIQPDPEKLEAIESFPRPVVKKHVRSFLGLANYYRKFIPTFSDLASPLTDLTQKHQPNSIVWNSQCEKAFTVIKELLMQQPILASPNFNAKFLVQTDASEFGIGCVLSQSSDSGEHPIMYLSRKLLPRERVYPTIEKECLAIVWAINKLHVYLYGREFVVQTDHQPLQWLERMKNTSSRLMRWSLLLQPYTFSIQHRSGNCNQNADALSRMYDTVN